MKYREASKSCANCGVNIVRQRGQKLSNFMRDKTCSKECRYALTTGERSKVWKGGISDDGNGYLRQNNIKKRVHRIVMEEHLGRKLEPWEEVHHINEDKRDNDISNLQLMTKQEHTSITFKGKRRPDSWRIARGLSL